MGSSHDFEYKTYQERKVHELRIHERWFFILKTHAGGGLPAGCLTQPAQENNLQFLPRSHHRRADQRGQPQRRCAMEDQAGALRQEPAEERALPAGQRERARGVQEGALPPRDPDLQNSLSIFFHPSFKPVECLSEADSSCPVFTE